MQKITLFFLLFFFASCQMNKKAGTNPLSTDAVSTDMSCEMFYFIVQRKVYQVTYNGKDSIRTLCGSAKYDMFNLIDKRKLTSTTINFDTIFLDRSKKLTDSQILQLNKCVSRVKTLGKVPKPGVDIKDGWYVYLSVGKLAIYEFKFNLERTQELKDIYELFVTLRKYSPIEFDTNCNGYVMENGYEYLGKEMKYNYYDSNKIVIHGKAVPGQTLAWGETKMLTADKIQSVNTTDYWGNVLYENSRPTTVLSNGRYILLNQDSTLTWCSVEKDHLGSNRVVREETSGINRLQINHYYPFGNTFGEYNHCDENTDLQRYKFNGKELDLVHGLRLYDYGARMYDQILGCWTSVDPMAEKYYHISPYVFCADNPVNIIDPDGKVLQIDGDWRTRMTILKELQRLTNDNLHIDKQGYVTLYGNKRWDNRHKKLTLGTNLVRDIISHKGKMTIHLSNDENQEYPNRNSSIPGSDVYFNPIRRTQVTVADKNGNASSFNNMPFLALGHEMIHGFRDMNGVSVDIKIKQIYANRNYLGVMYKKCAPVEELVTTGIIGNYKYTDNKLRKEHGYAIRLFY